LGHRHHHHHHHAWPSWLRNHLSWGAQIKVGASLVLMTETPKTMIAVSLKNAGKNPTPWEAAEPLLIA
jgi:hypothetical protein